MRNLPLIAVLAVATIQNIGVSGWGRGRMILERAYFTELNKRIIDGVMRIDKINKTSYGMSANVSVKEDFPDTTFNVKVYAMFSNEYRPMPITIEKNMCDVFKKEFKWLEINNTNIPKECPVKKNLYYIRNHVPKSMSKFPFDFPWERVMLKVYAKIDNTEKIVKKG